MESKIFSFVNKKSNDKKMLLFSIASVADIYNSVLYKYTKSFMGRIAVPKTNTTDIPKQFISVQEYINSKTVWKTILNFVNSHSGIDIKDYIDTMVRNWSDIQIYINNDKLKRPSLNIIFSSKIFNLYHTFKDKEETNKLLNKSLNINRGEDFYRLTPSLQSNINSLFNLKNINPEMSFKDIVKIFAGEFEPQFKDLIFKLNDEEITQEKLARYFN